MSSSPTRALAVGLAVVAALSNAATAERIRDDPRHGWRLRYRADPDPIPRNAAFVLDVALEDTSGAARKLTLVAVSARMPDHGHGMTLDPVVRDEGGGRFRVEGLLLHMPGRWELEFVIAAGHERATTRVEVSLFDETERQKIAALSPLPPPPDDPSNAYDDDPRAAQLGQQLFFDPRLSANGKISCATCHDPRRDFSNGAPLGVGLGVTRRHVQALWNVAYARWLFWDGRADSLWSQAISPLEHPDEQGADRAQLARLVASDDSLRERYEAVFGALPSLGALGVPEHAAPIPEHAPRAQAWAAMTPAARDAVDRVIANLGKAIAAYERLLVSTDAPFDRFAASLAAGGDGDGALSNSAQRGLALFVGRADCVRCHSGPNFSDGEFHDTGVPTVGERRDPGRHAGIELLRRDPFNSAGAYSDGEQPTLRFLARRPEAIHQFKTPSLRNVARTAPYMHDGRMPTLEAVVRFYSTRDGAVTTHGERGLLQPLDLSDGEVADLVAFLESLTGAPLPEALTHAPQ